RDFRLTEAVEQRAAHRQAGRQPNEWCGSPGDDEVLLERVRVAVSHEPDRTEMRREHPRARTRLWLQQPRRDVQVGVGPAESAGQVDACASELQGRLRPQLAVGR